MRWKYNDGGRADAGFKGTAGDCCCRAFAIATGRPYREVYNDINRLAKSERTGTRKRHVSSARNGVYRDTAKKLAKLYGMEWVPVMKFGSGCVLHMRKSELPKGRLVLSVSKHFTCVIDGVLYDTYDCSRGGKRCVYGYWKVGGKTA